MIHFFDDEPEGEEVTEEAVVADDEEPTDGDT